MGKTEESGKGREAKEVREKEKDREWVRGRRRECGMGLEEGRIGRRDGSLRECLCKSGPVDFA